MTTFSITDYIGSRYGRLTVTGLSELKRYKGTTAVIVDCLCDCGNLNSYHLGNLKRGTTRSCGCLRDQSLRSRPAVSPFSRYRSNYLRSAKKRRLTFDLDLTSFTSLVTADCHYCGHPPVSKKFDNYKTLVCVNGLDRIDSTVGYTSTNVVPCCAQCNTAKLDYTTEEFDSWLKRVYEHRFG